MAMFMLQCKQLIIWKYFSLKQVTLFEATGFVHVEKYKTKPSVGLATSRLSYNMLLDHIIRLIENNWQVDKFD